MDKKREFEVLRNYFDDGEDAVKCPQCDCRYRTAQLEQAEDGRRACSCCGYAEGDEPKPPACIIF